jgi:hypothetical protein
VARNISSLIPHCVGGEASISLVPDVIGWRQSKSTGETLRTMVIVRSFTKANHGLLPCDNLALDTAITDYDMEMKREAVQKKLHQMAKVYNI